MKETRYLVTMKDNDPFIVNVKDDVNRPNNPSCEDVLDDYMVENYGLNVEYWYYDLDTCEQVNL
jgi:hypothetical protein